MISLDADRRIFDLTGRTAAVTGAGSGLGRVFSSALATFGARVFCLDRNIDAAKQTAEQIIKTGGQAEAFLVDVVDEKSIREFAVFLTESGHVLDILVNNAGVISVPARVHEMNDDAWHSVIDVSLNGTFRCTRALLPVMLASEGGSIVNVSSVLGLTGFFPGFPGISASYNAAKAGIIGLTRQLAAEYAPDNIRCNVIAPGWHQGTNLGAQRRSARPSEVAAAFDERIIQGTPMRRKGDPDELRGLMVFLASTASSFVTGQIFVQDGGWTAI